MNHILNLLLALRLLINGLNNKEINMKFKFFYLMSLILIGCVPSPNTEVSDLTEVEIESRNKECNMYLSFATTNYQNRDYLSAIENYAEVIALGCSKINAEQIFQWMGRSYIELNKLDSAAYIFKQGLKYLPNDISLLEVTAWNEGRMENIENQIFYYEKIIEIDESNTSIMKKLSDIYRDKEMYDDQLQIINKWLKVDKTNKIAIGEKKAAYLALGKDVSDVDRQRWEKDMSNIQYGLEYVNSLMNNEDQNKALEVLLKLRTYDKFNKDILEKMSSIYLDNSENNLALDSFQNLYKIEKNYKTAIEISKILIEEEDYKSALDWSITAIEDSGENGASLFQRAEVYFALADACSGESLTFNDKLVYEISFEDYSSALKKGFYRARARKEFLEENNITSKGDWFMLGNETLAKPEGNCYDWITRKVSKK